MSLIKSATRRLSLLAGSSLVAAGLTAAASFGVAFAPTTAFAANECGDPAANGTAADTFLCPVATYPTGIQHTSVGDLSVTVQGGSNFGTGGVVSTGAGGDDLVLKLSIAPSGTVTHSFNTAFPALLNAESQSGDVLVEVEAQRTGVTFGPTIQANNAATTRAIRAVSTAGGDVVVRARVRGSTGNADGTIQSNTNPNAVAIEARSVGGGDVTVDLDRGLGRGRLYGILAQTDGDGDVTIRGSGDANTSVAGSAGLRVIAGVGDVDIVGGRFGDSLTAFSGQTGVFVNSSGNIDFTGRATGTVYGIDLANVAAGKTATLNLLGTRAQNSGDVQATTGGTAAIRAQGAGDVVVNIVGVQSAMNFDFTGLSGSSAVNVKAGGAWAPAVNTSSVLSGNFDINIEEGGLLVSGVQTSGTAAEPATVLTFTNPAMSLVNAGYIVVGPAPSAIGSNPISHEAELRIVGLNEFRNSGDILLGSCGEGCALGSTRVQGVIVSQTDGAYDDLLVFQDGTWIGEGGRIIFDVDTNRTQTSCTRQPVTHDFGAADCVRIVNSTVEGTTYVSLNQALAGDRGRLTQQSMDEGILLIDAAGSTVTAENFLIDPSLKGFNPRSQSLDKGLFQYVLLFDEDATQFKLFPTLTGAAYQLPMAATAAHNLWRTSTGSWLNRQADLRHSMPEELGGGIWIRALGEQTDREIASLSTLGGLPFTVDNTHRQDTYAINGGVDIFSGSDGNTGYVVGLTAGYAHTDVEYETSGNTQAMDAWTGGVYGGLVVGQLFVDAVVSANNVIIDTDAPGFGLQPEGTILSSRMVSLGGQVEAGWRLLFDGGFFAEPLASVSYVRSKLDDLEIRPDDPARPGLAVSFEDPSSFRAGVGARVGLDRQYGGVRTQVSLLGRIWNDLEGQNTAVIHNLAFPDDPEIRVVDDFSSTFNEFAVGGSVWAPGGVVSGFFLLGGKFGDDYEAKTGSVGVRVAW